MRTAQDATGDLERILPAQETMKMSWWNQNSTIAEQGKCGAQRRLNGATSMLNGFKIHELLR